MPLRSKIAHLREEIKKTRSHLEWLETRLSEVLAELSAQQEQSRNSQRQREQTKSERTLKYFGLPDEKDFDT